MSNGGERQWRTKSKKFSEKNIIVLQQMIASHKTSNTFFFFFSHRVKCVQRYSYKHLVNKTLFAEEGWITVD